MFGLRAVVSRTKISSAVFVRTMSTVNYQFETLKVDRCHDFVVHVELNRPQKRNAMNLKMYSDIVECFNKIDDDEDVRAVVLTGAGKTFCSGIDVMDLAGSLSAEMDAGRKAFHIKKLLKFLQESNNVIDRCRKPVIAAIHNFCIGGGVDLISACDIRYCTKDTSFSIKEVDIGLAADLGTLQRLPKIVGNDSLVRELVFTGRLMAADEAASFGLVSRIFSDKESMLLGAMNVAKEIASKSPVAVQGSKLNLNYSRDHSVQDGLEYISAWNMGMLQSEDLMKATMASMEKKKPVFSKL